MKPARPLFIILFACALMLGASFHWAWSRSAVSNGLTRASLSRFASQLRMQEQEQEQHGSISDTPKPLADGCHTVYLDLGTNIGIQIRKVYEPHLYPGSRIETHFNTYFGAGDRHHVCTFGWEPNWMHNNILGWTEYVYRIMGYRVHVFQQSGVYDRHVMAEFVSDNSPDAMYWASKVKVPEQANTNTNAPRPHKFKYPVQLFNFGEWYRDNVFTRTIPPYNETLLGPPKVVMKLDIEGPDWSVVSQLITMGLWCSLSMVYEEHLTDAQQRFLGQMNSMLNDCPTKQLKVDDEEYFNSLFPFPVVFPTQAARATWLDRLPLPNATQPQLPTNKP